MKTWAPKEWFLRYEKRITEYHLPDEDEERLAFAHTVGIDGYHLLEMVYSSTTSPFLKEIPAIEILRQVWVQQYYRENNQVYWREKGNLPPAAVAISSPHDAQARYSNKRETTVEESAPLSAFWVGYKVHLTETCDEDAPHLITSVTTTVATEPDNNLTTKIHQDLAEKSLLPQEHLVDRACTSGL
ncbi:MAG: hypothetical protein ACYS6K_18805 [Planctomycetota bacterium]